MSYTVEPIVAPAPVNNTLEQNQFALPVAKFTGYDPKGTTTVTGSQRVIPDSSQSQTSEATPAVEPAPPEESVKLSPQVSALARKEADQRRREQAFKQQQKDMASKLADADKYAQLKAKLASKDFSAAEELGLSYEQYTQYKLDKGLAEKPEDQRYLKVEKELEDLKKNQEEQTLKDYQANQAAWKQEISKTVNDGEAYPTLKAWGQEALDAVLKHVNDSFDEDETELTVEQAAKEIEEHLEKHADSLAEKIFSLPRFKQKFQEQNKVLGPPKAGAKTITQTMTMTSQKPASKPFHLMSESEQIAEAIRRVQAEKQRQQQR